MDPLEIHFRFGQVGVDVFIGEGGIIVIDYYKRCYHFDSIDFNPYDNFPSWLWKDGVRFCGVKVNPNPAA